MTIWDTRKTSDIVTITTDVGVNTMGWVEDTLFFAEDTPVNRLQTIDGNWGERHRDEKI